VTDFGYTGQRDHSFGLLDYNARYYSSRLGRFTSPDSIVPQPGNPQAWNRYAYVRNNPVKLVDPTGHADECGFTSGGGGCGCPNCGEVYRYIANAKQWRKEALKPIDDVKDAIHIMRSEPHDIDIYGVNIGWISPSYTGPTFGVEATVRNSREQFDPTAPLESEPFTLDDLGLYSYDGQSTGTGLGGSISPYYGRAWNVEKFEDYLGPFKSLNVTVAMPEGGVSGTWFWAPPGDDERSFDPNLPFGFAFGLAVGGEISISRSTTFYRPIHPRLTPPSYRNQTKVSQ
jgi:RHS repeat-associated protein